MQGRHLAQELYPSWPLYFSTFCQRQHPFAGKEILSDYKCCMYRAGHKMCVFALSRNLLFAFFTKIVQKYDTLLPAKTTYFYDIFSLKYFPIPSLDAWLKCHMPLCIGLCCACVCGVNRPISPSPPPLCGAKKSHSLFSCSLIIQASISCTVRNKTNFNIYWLRGN